MKNDNDSKHYILHFSFERKGKENHNLVVEIKGI